MMRGYSQNQSRVAQNVLHVIIYIKTFYAPYEAQSFHHFAAASNHWVRGKVLWTVFVKALWMEHAMALGMVLGMALGMELSTELCLSTSETVLWIPHRRCHIPWAALGFSTS